MRIQGFRVSNYKAFGESPWLDLDPHINLIVGENDVGKSALIRAMSTQIASSPHCGSMSKQARTTVLNEVSSVTAKFLVRGNELRELILRHGPVLIPVPAGSEADRAEFFQRMFAGEESISVTLTVQQAPGGRAIGGRDMEKSYSTPILRTNGAPVYFLASPNVSRSDVEFRQAGGSTDQLAQLVANLAESQIYRFDAERLKIGECAFGASTQLRPDATNLPEVLANLQSNPGQFQDFIRLVSRVLPSVKWVSVRGKLNHNLAEIIIWRDDARSKRDDLAMPLADSGTGVAQVLAILAVIAQADTPRIFLIDEPNSFLHPYAAKALVSIFRERPEHQFVISTHSGDIAIAAQPATTWQLKREGTGQTEVHSIDAKDFAQMGACLADLGVSPADFFGADAVFWVEGPTEQDLFNELANHGLIPSYPRVAFLPVRSVSEFAESKKLPVELVIDIYRRVTNGVATLPPAVAFLFDREERSDSQLDRLVRDSGGRVKFLSRRMIENYLLDPKSISQMLLLEGADLAEVREDYIAEWIEANAGNSKYEATARGGPLLEDDEFLRTVHGARLLSDLIQEITGAKFEYRKRAMGSLIAKFSALNGSRGVRELGAFVTSELIQAA